MTVHNSAIAARTTSVSALGWGLLGVTAFSFTVPFTRVAAGGLDPLFIGCARAVVAAVLAGAALAVTRQASPCGAQWRRLAVVGGGIVVGFPLLTSFALASVPASHGAVVIALLPAATATAVVVRTREFPPPAFWAVAAAGAVAAVGFATAGDGTTQLQWADLLLFGAVVAAAIGYAEGGLLARELGAWQTVSWALVGCAVPMAALTAVAVAAHPPTASPTQWAAFGYLGVVSMFLGFVAWYRGLAIGPMAQVSQVQLVQPVLSIGWAALLLGERVGVGTAVGGAAVIGCAAGAVRIRSGRTPARSLR